MADRPAHSPSSACASTTTAASSAAAACSSAAGASTPSTSAPSPTTAPAAPATAASPTARRRHHHREEPARLPRERQLDAGPAQGRLAAGRDRRRAAHRHGQRPARTSTSSTTWCSTRARSPTPPSTRCASRWSCAPTWAASPTASASTSGPDGFKLKKDGGFAAGIRLDTPIMFAPMSYGSVSLNVHKSLAMAAEAPRHPHEHRRGRPARRPLPLSRTTSSCRWPRAASASTPTTSTAAPPSRSRSARAPSPASAATCPARRSTRTVSTTRMIPQGSDAISPAPHHDIYSIEDLRQLIYSIKEATGYKPVGVKIAAVHNVAAIASGIVRAGADYVYLDGFRGGTGAAPQVIRDHVGIPLEIAIAVVDQRLRDEGIRKRRPRSSPPAPSARRPTWPRPSRSAPTPSPSARRRSSPSAATSARAATPAAAAGGSRRRSPSSRGASTPSGAPSASSTWCPPGATSSRRSSAPSA